MLMTQGDVAAYLQKAEGTLKNWRYLGVGPKWLKGEGREVRYRREDVDEWLDKQRHGR